MQIAVGQIVRAHGIRGEVLVAVRTDEPDVRFVPGAVLATEPPGPGPLTVAAARWHTGRAPRGVRGRPGPERRRGSARHPAHPGFGADTFPDDPDEFYDHQLIGLGVVTAAGEPVGVVTDVLHHGQDLLVVRRDGRPGTAGAQGPGGPAAGEALVPFVGAIVTDVDVAAGRLVIDPPAGLLDPDEAIEA